MSPAWGIALCASSALAAPPASLRIVGDEKGCPTPGQVSGLLGPLLPASKIGAASGPSGMDDITIYDDGASFRVVAAGQERSFADPVRECLERARHAAVFVALALDPPAITPSRPAPPAPERPEPVEPLPARRGPPLDLQVGAMLQEAPGSATRATARAFGAAATLRWGRQAYVAGGVGFLAGSFHFQSADAKVMRFPIDLAFGLNIRSAPYDFAAELGPALTLFGVTGENLAGSSREWRLDVGGRAAATARAWIGDRIGLFVSAHAEAFVRPYKLLVVPLDGRSEVGSTPWLWWGGSVGLVSRLE
jgi:hypothetical protein